MNRSHQQRDYSPVTLPSATEQIVDYYDIGGIETIEIIRSKLTDEQFVGFLKGNIIKYMCRAGHKPNTPSSHDYYKANYYSSRLLDFSKQ